MAYYAATYNGKLYVNRDFLKTLYGVGDAGVLDMLADGTIAQYTILDRMVLHISGYKRLGALGSAHVQHQDIDAQIAEFYSVGFDACPGNRLYVPRDCKTFVLAGVEFVRLQDMQNCDKYRAIRNLPHIVFMGKKYIALNVACTNRNTAIVSKEHKKGISR